MEFTAPIERHPTRTLPVVIDELADRFESAPALSSKRTTLSYRALAADTHRYSRWALAQGLIKGDVVSLLMPNCPEYMAIWLGLTRVGITVALINTHLTDEGLAHSIDSVAPRIIIIGSALTGALHGAREGIDGKVRCWALGPTDHDLASLEPEIAKIPGERLADGDFQAPSLEDRALYIYTSGTTGLSKAANVSHFRIMQWSHWFAGLMETGPSDRMYNCLPMYHGVGGIVATGATLIGGGAVVLRERFSAHDFWPDVAQERCTVFQYIGELCRYLVSSPTHADETRHCLRLCCGNGLQADIWDRFKTRFCIPHILEYYAATEGTFSLYNCEGRAGAIGRIPAYLAHRIPVAIVAFDFDNDVPARNESGFCVRCGPNEVGEAIGEIFDANGNARSRFEGYADSGASQKKILRDVFHPGDAWYRSGDLMRQDEQGFFYFIDRVGDTYRWKGENVATTEVSTVVTAAPAVTEAVTYGVQVPSADGRVGMCAIVVTAGFDLGAFRSHVADKLPEYARPRFIRIVPAIELTGTLRLKKRTLMLEGYDPGRILDALYFDDQHVQTYVRLDAALYERIRSGRLLL